jgi:hypothetical protein
MEQVPAAWQLDAVEYPEIEQLPAAVQVDCEE